MALDRRTFLKLGGAGIVGVAFAPLLAGCEDHSVEALGGGSAAPFLTPADQFFVQNGGEGSIIGWTRPVLTQEGWEMTIDGFQSGDVANPLTVRYADLMAARDAGAEITILKTIGCILESPLRLTPTGYMGTAYWTGVPLRIFLERAGLSPSIKRLLMYGADGFANNITIERLTNAAADGLAEPLLVYQMNGAPLPSEHGFPVRLIIQEGYGYKNVKWITRVSATVHDIAFGTYQDQGFIDDGTMRVTSRSTVIRDDITIAAGTIEISGFAVSGYAPVSKVEVSIDDGAFVDAELVSLEELQRSQSLPPTIAQLAAGLTFPYRAVWAPWRLRWSAPPGRHRIAIRALDAAGNLQPESDRDLFDGQTGVTTYDITVT